MKRLIRNKTTKEFFAGGKWVADFRKAQPFRNTEAVYQAAKDYGLKDVEQYYLFYDHALTSYDFATTLR